MLTRRGGALPALLILAALAALAGCGGGLSTEPLGAPPSPVRGGSAAPSGTSAPTATPGTPRPGGGAVLGAPGRSEIRAGRFATDPAVLAYARYAVARDAALRGAGRGYRPLLLAATDQRLSVDYRALLEQERAGLRQAGRLVETVVRVEPAGAGKAGAAPAGGARQATVSLCADAAAYRPVDDTGAPAGPAPRSGAREALLVRPESAWKVAEIRDAAFSCEGVR